MSEPIPGPSPRRLSAVSPLLDAYMAARQLILPALIAAAGGQLLLVTLGAVVITALRTVSWWRRTYDIREGALVLSEGIIRRKQRVVPLERIQQVNVDRKLRHRIFGVARLKVQTASGGSGAELDLDAVADAEAERLRAALQAPRTPAPQHPEEPALLPPAGRVLVRLSYGDAALAGVTDARLPLFAALLAGASQLIEVVGDQLGGTLERLTASVDASGPVVLLLAGAAVAAVLGLWFLIGAASGVLANAEYVLVEEGDRLTCTRGLLSKREVVLLRHRVQVVRVEASPLRRLLRRCEVVIQSAGKTGEEDRIVVPLLPMHAVEQLVAVLLPGTTPLPSLQRHPVAAAQRLRIRRLLVVSPALLAAAVAGMAVDPAWWAAVPLVAVVALGGAELAYRGLAHGYRRGVLLSQSGALARRLVVVPADRAQSARVYTSPLQRRRDLATLAVDIAGGGPTPRVADGSQADLGALLRRLLEDRRPLTSPV